MRVLTLDDRAFAGHCKMLEQRVLSDGYVPDLIIGIARGGEFVAGRMFEGVPHVSVKLQRPQGGERSQTVGRFVHAMPRWINNLMRMAESLLLTLKSHHLSRVDLPGGLDGYKRILVVDDAVDSGATLASVIAALGGRCRTAALTVTALRKPLAMPDYYLFNNHTLIRFPWSTDS